MWRNTTRNRDGFKSVTWLLAPSEQPPPWPCVSFSFISWWIKLKVCSTVVIPSGFQVFLDFHKLSSVCWGRHNQTLDTTNRNNPFSKSHKLDIQDQGGTNHQRFSWGSLFYTAAFSLSPDLYSLHQIPVPIPYRKTCNYTGLGLPPGPHLAVVIPRRPHLHIQSWEELGVNNIVIHEWRWRDIIQSRTPSSSSINISDTVEEKHFSIPPCRLLLLSFLSYKPYRLCNYFEQPISFQKEMSHFFL